MFKSPLLSLNLGARNYKRVNILVWLSIMIGIVYTAFHLNENVAPYQTFFFSENYSILLIKPTEVVTPPSPCSFDDILL